VKAEPVTTPFLDLLLLSLLSLLAIYASRREVSSLDLQVPSVAGPAAPVKGRPLVLAMAADGTLQFDGTAVARDELLARCRTERPAVLLQADAVLPSGQVIDLLSELQPVCESVQVQVVRTAERGR
jgi:biopolymer transport protein ExbD